MSDDLKLFDPSRTSPTPCPVPGCQAIRFPNQERVVTCEVERERALGNPNRYRPSICLNAYDPATASFPDGY